ncbi:MAG: hypothetical protein PHY47_15795 [Lachnospiraceae bacterium]|nr:hypothetical protein [Lachnospiraceae bacterium]
MIERAIFRPIYCPVCGRYLLKAKDGAEVVVNCERCNGDIIATVKDGTISTMEDRRDKLPKRHGAVSVRVVKEKKKKCSQMEDGTCLNTKAM